MACDMVIQVFTALSVSPRNFVDLSDTVTVIPNVGLMQGPADHVKPSVLSDCSVG